MIVGFDVGRKRIGVAVGQLITQTASPLVTLRTEPAEVLWQAIQDLVYEWHPTQWVVGWPTHADGRANAVTRRAQAFVAELQRRYALPVDTIDERLSSHAAARWQTTHRGAAVGLDAVAAAIILESWLQQHSTGS